jgi:hypothetical protein
MFSSVKMQVKHCLNTVIKCSMISTPHDPPDRVVGDCARRGHGLFLGRVIAAKGSA